MSEDRKQKIRGTMKTFTHFVSVGTTTIWELRSKATTSHEHLSAYRHLVEFIHGLPLKIKKDLLDDIRDIDEQIGKISELTGVDINESIASQSGEIRQLLSLGQGMKLWSKMNDLLDAAGYKEIPEVTPIYSDRRVAWRK